MKSKNSMTATKYRFTVVSAEETAKADLDPHYAPLEATVEVRAFDNWPAAVRYADANGYSLTIEEE